MVQAYLKELLHKIYHESDIEWIGNHSAELTDIEYGQTFSDYKNAALYVYNLCKAQGFQTELLSFPADGKAEFLDFGTPMAWDATKGSLTVVQSSIPFDDPILADFQKMPFSLVKHSVSTPENGIRVPVVCESQVRAGADCTGALVLLEAQTAPRQPAISYVLDQGAIGFVADYLRGADTCPDGVQWVNAGTDIPNQWHVRAEDRDFIGYSISPRIGKKLRQAILAGPVEVLAISDGHRYEGEIHAVTALIPGKRKEELWLFGHLYEPFVNDNAVAVMMTISGVKQLQRMIEEGALPPLEYSIRLVYAMESYGAAAVASYFGGDMNDRAIGGFNIDCPPVLIDDDKFCLRRPGYASPFFGKAILQMATQAYEEYFTEKGMEYAPTSKWVVEYGDDTILGDSTVGVPTLYMDHDYSKCPYWHNSWQDTSFLDMEKLRKAHSLFQLWLCIVATMSKTNLAPYVEEAAHLSQQKLYAEAAAANAEGNPALRMKFFLEGESRELRAFKKVADIPEIEAAAAALTIPDMPFVPIESAWLTHANSMIPSRATIGFPYGLGKVPKDQRRILPDGVIYGPMACILSAMDGKRDLGQLILGALWECGRPITDDTVKTYVDAVEYLCKWGYLTCE